MSKYELRQYDYATDPYKMDAPEHSHSEAPLLGYIESGELTLHRVVALRDISCHGVSVGDVGGFVEGYANLSQDGDCWVADIALVVGDAHVSGNALVSGTAWVDIEALVMDDAVVTDSAQVTHEAVLSGESALHDSCYVGDYSRITGKVTLRGSVHVEGRSHLSGVGEIYTTQPLSIKDEVMDVGTMAHSDHE